MMNLDEIKIKWTLKENDKKSNISLWDEKADYFGNYAIPTIEEDKFLKLLKDEKILNKKFKVLDVGCGGGKYSLALANECDEILGIDLSPKMIEYANKNKENFNIKNTSFLCENWHDINVKKTNLYSNFDLVFASMTPAVASASTFEKFMECSRKYCVLRCNIKRNDFIYDGIRKELSMEQTKENLNFLYAFKMIYLKGYLPKIFYEEKKWIYEEPLDKAFNVYIKKIKSLKSVDMKEENQIRELINKISKDGYVKEEISSVISTIIWTVK